MAGKISKIIWSDKLKALPQSTYESLGLLYKEIRSDVFGEHVGLILSCTKDIQSPQGCPACLHKLEIVASPNFSDAHMEITHEVLPELGSSSEIINVNDNLLAACFDSGSLMEVKNFGFKKTFNSDVRGRLVHHTGPINCLATDSTGSQLACGTTNGEIGLYSVTGEKINFLSRSKVDNHFITGLCYLQPSDEICYKPDNMEISAGAENILVYSTSTGHVGFVDTRCKIGANFNTIHVMTTEPRLNISTLCSIPELPGHQVYFGTAHGQVVAVDFRYPNDYLYKQNLTEDGCIRRMRRIVVFDDSDKKKLFLAYTNNTNEIKILDIFTKQSDERWICDRSPNAKQRDLKQIGNRIVTCGDQTSIGSWVWNSAISLNEKNIHNNNK